MLLACRYSIFYSGRTRQKEERKTRMTGGAAVWRFAVGSEKNPEQETSAKLSFYGLRYVNCELEEH